MQKYSISARRNCKIFILAFKNDWDFSNQGQTLEAVTQSNKTLMMGNLTFLPEND